MKSSIPVVTCFRQCVDHFVGGEPTMTLPLKPLFSEIQFDNQQLA